MKWVYIATVALTLAVFGHGSALAHGAHRHGDGQLFVSIDGARLIVRLESPLDNLLGFERAPRTPAERAAADRLRQHLSAGEGLFQPSAAAGCQLTHASIEAPVLEGRAAEGGHADLAAEWHYTCRAPQHLTGLRVLLFRDYRRLTRLQAAVVGPRGQRAQRLTARMPDLAW